MRYSHFNASHRLPHFDALYGPAAAAASGTRGTQDPAPGTGAIVSAMPAAASEGRPPIRVRELSIRVTAAAILPVRIYPSAASSRISARVITGKFPMRPAVKKERD